MKVFLIFSVLSFTPFLEALSSHDAEHAHPEIHDFFSPVGFSLEEILALEDQASETSYCNNWEVIGGYGYHANNKHYTKTIYRCRTSGQIREEASETGYIYFYWFDNRQYNSTHHQYVQAYRCNLGDYNYETVTLEGHSFQGNWCNQCGYTR